MKKIVFIISLQMVDNVDLQKVAGEVELQLKKVFDAIE
jgi:hypothetical protein